MLNFKTFLVPFILILASFSGLNAENGDPIAIRHWPGGGFTVESMWDLHVGVGLNDEAKSLLPRPVDAELEKLPGLKGVVCTLFREANSAEVKLVEEGFEDKSHPMLLVISKEYETKDHLNARPLSLGTTVSVDGVSVGFLDHDRMTMEKRMKKLKAITPAQKKSGEGEKKGLAHSVVVATGAQFTQEFCDQYAKAYKPAMMIVNASIKSVGDVEVEAVSHNTVAFSQRKKDSMETRFVSLGTSTYKMTDEVTELFSKKEASQKNSREMFAKLSVEQMNFEPANGSHTPRWNAEHMMAMELKFFSEIYNAVDPSIPVLNLAPQQMPKDYKFAHPDWTGEEEARQMKRVENFTRRFAYMLDGMDLDKRAKGSRFWTPRRLLAQMERHYKEHSGNVVKKMKLDGWPEK